MPDPRLGQAEVTRLAEMRAAAALVVLLVACSSPVAEPTATPRPTAEGQPTPSQQASPTTDTSPSPDAALILVDGLTVRSEPSQTAAAIPCDFNDGMPVLLNAGAVVWILDGTPVEAEGYSWNHVVVNATYPSSSLSGEAPCHEVPTLVGWVASPRDDPWLGTVDSCRGAPTEVEELSELANEPLLALACFSQKSLTIEGWYPTIPEGIGFSCPGIEPGWLTCSLEAVQASADGIGIRVRVPPTLAMPARGGRIVVTGHFDDAAAASCVPADLQYVGQLQATFYCRTQFVLDAARSAS